LAVFSVVRREGIELTSNFTAPVNVELKVGTLEETVTVTGESPVVDTQNTVQQRVIPKDVLDALPVGKSFNLYTALVPGAIGTATNQDVGGTKGENTQGFKIHGGTAAGGPRQRSAVGTSSSWATGCSAARGSGRGIPCRVRPPPRYRKSPWRRAAFPPTRKPAAAISTWSRAMAATSTTARSKPTTGTIVSRAITS